MKHTPGPWQLHLPDTDKRLLVLHPDGQRIVASLSVGFVSPVKGEIPFDERLANARLMAAAPDLLCALENADKLITLLMPGIKHIVLQDYGFLNETLLANTAAIAKAKGETNAENI